MISLTEEQIMDKVTEYVSRMETEQSTKWCKCEWIVHPDDVDIPDDVCRKCSQPREDTIHLPSIYSEDVNLHPFLGKRQRRGDTHMECPVHTKEGFLLGFLKWADLA